MFTLRFLLIALVAPLSSVLCAQAATNATSNPTNSGNGTFTSDFPHAFDYHLSSDAYGLSRLW
jgi:hypothetical protein